MAKINGHPDSVQAGLPKLGALPSGWERAPLSQYLTEVRRPAALDPNELYTLVTVKRSRGGVVEREKLLGKQIKVPTQFYVREGDFLISKRQIVHGACGIVPAELDGAIVSNEYAVLRSRGAFSLPFLRYLSESAYFQQTCFHSSIGVHIEKMLFKLDQWLDWKFDLPSAAEQGRIFEMLATWDRTIECIENLVENNQAQKKVLTSQLLTGKRRLQEFSSLNWSFRPLGEICSVKGEYGANAPSIPFSSTDPRYLRITDIDEYGELGGADPRSVSRESADGKYLAKGDLVFARSGATVGKTYLHSSDDELVFAGYLIRFRPDPSVVSPGFLAQFLKSDEYWGWVNTMIRAGAQPNINAQEYSSLVVPVPSIEEQIRIAGILRGIDDQHVNLVKQLKNLRQQRQALLQQLLTGTRRVRPQELAA